MAALIGFYQSNQVERIESDASNQVAQISATVPIAVAQIAEQIITTRTWSSRRQHDGDEKQKSLPTCAHDVPMLLSDDQRARDEAVAMVLLLYPNDADRVFGLVHDRIISRPGASQDATPEPLSPAPTADRAQLTPAPLVGATPVAPTPVPTPTAAPTAAEQADTLSAAVLQAQVVKAMTGTWLMVVGSDATLEEANFEVSRAGEYGGVRIYKRGPWFATTIGNLPTREQAESTLISVPRCARGHSW